MALENWSGRRGAGWRWEDKVLIKNSEVEEKSLLRNLQVLLVGT
jgi:hypothetical protein